MQEAGDNLHVGLLHGPRGEGAGSNPDSSGDGGALVSDNGVLVEGDVGDVADLLDLGSGEAEGTEIPEDEVVVRTGSLELVVVREEDLGDGLVGRGDVSRGTESAHLDGVGLTRALATTWVA